jgi:hypothetical protein
MQKSEGYNLLQLNTYGQSTAFFFPSSICFCVSGVALPLAA